MAKKVLKPVSVAGIEFDALISQQTAMSASIPTYPIEDGFPVSDSIILEPLSIQLTLFVTNTPVTWLQRHGSAQDRVNTVCDKIEKLWLEKKLVKVVTTDAIYKDMGITSITISKSKEIGYAREIQMSLQKVQITKRKTVKIPSYLLKSGTTKANAGTATTSPTSDKTGSGSGSPTSSTGKKNKNKTSESKNKKSILFGIADGMGFI